MWMTPFYLFFGVLFIELFKNQINLKKLNKFFTIFFILFFLSPSLYGYISISKDNKRTDYPGKEIAKLVEEKWKMNFSNEINYVIGDEWNAGNLSYHLKSRPIWYENIKNENELRQNGGIIYVSGNTEFKEKCSGKLEKINMQIFCMVGTQ